MERTVHVDPARVLVLRRLIAAARDLYRRRVAWLGTGGLHNGDGVVVVELCVHLWTFVCFHLFLSHISLLRPFPSHL